MAQSIFETIEGLTVTRDEILEAELFAEQYLSAQFPTYDFRQGTALRDMTVRPNATLLALVDKAIRYYFDQTDISNITDDTDESTVDDRFSNFFLTRKKGTNATIAARLYFSFPTGTPITTTIPSSAFFSPDNTIKYYPSSLAIVNPPATVEDPNQYYFRYDTSNDLWYVDLQLIASSPSVDSNLEEGDLLYFTVFSPYFLQAEIQYLVSASIDKETNTEMVARSYNSISTRNLINSPSIIARITDQFNYVNQVLPVGLGDPLMYRDMIDIVDPVDSSTRTFHRGGMTDIYIDSAITTTTQQFTTNADSKFQIQGPVLSLVRSTSENDDTGASDALYSYSVVGGSSYTDGIPDTPEKDTGLSANQVIEVLVADSNEGDTYTFDVQTFTGIGSINDAINSKDQRVVSADYLARAFEPVFLDITIDVRNSNGQFDVATEALQDFIDGIGYGQAVTVASLISTVQVAGITDIRLPISVTAVTQVRSPSFSDDPLNPQPIDKITEAVTDIYNLRGNQMFYPRTITFNEVTTP